MPKLYLDSNELILESPVVAQLIKDRSDLLQELKRLVVTLADPKSRYVTGELEVTEALIKRIEDS